MRIEDYFQAIREVVDTCPIVQLSTMRFDKRGTHQGFIRGELYYVDGSVLHLREFVDVESSVDRLTYAYQYMDATNRLVFRYDNSGHHKKLNLPTHPHHKHEGSETNIVTSSVPSLKDVLGEIELLVKLS